MEFGKVLRDGQMINATKNSMRNKYVVLTRDLNFKSRTSYADSQRTDFGDINGNENDGNKLIEELNTGSGFIPIGNDPNYSSGFLGNFDGKYHKIQNIWINKPEIPVALFGTINMNTHINDMDTIIENITISGNIIGKSAGGILGRISTDFLEEKVKKIQNCVNESNIVAKVAAGGIIGEKVSSQGTLIISECVNKGKVETKGNETVYAGGIIGVGYNKTSFINCYNLGKIEATTTSETDQNLVGGITGYYLFPEKILNCFNQGDLKANNNGIVGGLVGNGGWKECYLINCYNSGNIEGEIIGGLVGDFNISNTLLVTKNCYYINTKVNKAIGSERGIDATKEEGIIGCTEEELKSEKIVSNFNDIEPTQDYDVTNFNLWHTGENGYPSFEMKK